MYGLKGDEEAIPVNKPNQPLASIRESVGWNFPQVKLASWDPEDAEQWKVSTVTCIH